MTTLNSKNRTRFYEEETRTERIFVQIVERRMTKLMHLLKMCSFSDGDVEGAHGDCLGRIDFKATSLNHTAPFSDHNPITGILPRYFR